VIRLLVALLVNQFPIALRRRTGLVGTPSATSLEVTLTRGAGGAMVHSSKPFSPIRCSICHYGPEEGLHRRIPATTKLEQFLQPHKWRLTAIGHSMAHVAKHYGLDPLRGDRLLEIRRGRREATAAEQQLIALAVSNLLGELVPPSMLFDDADPEQATAVVRRQA
jgi:hypothetical protein